MARVKPDRQLDGTILGFDPGGSSRRGNGVAAIHVVGGEVAGVVSARFAGVNEAEDWARRQFIGTNPLGLGVDTLLAWSGSTCGWRAADHALRSAYPGALGSVIAPNGLYGSMCIGGPLFASRLRLTRPNLPLFETHPKLLYYHLRGLRYAWPGEMVLWLEALLGLSRRFEIESEDIFDAILSAYAAMMALAGAWKTDLYRLSPPRNLVFPVPGPAPRYPWPEELRNV